MDVGLKHMSFSLIRDVSVCFNPCFDGCWSKTFERVVFVLAAIGVSILVLMDVGLKPQEILV